MSSKIIELAKKLKALADRGVDGEKENAAEMLGKFMEKHKLSLEDIEGEKKRRRRFKVLADQKIFFNQICSNVLGRNYRVESTGQAIYKVVEVTDAEYVEILAKYEFYWKHYQKEQEIFYKAFIQKNQLYRKETDEERRQRQEREHERELTPEEKAELWKMANMMQGMDAARFHKQLNEG